MRESREFVGMSLTAANLQLYTVRSLLEAAVRRAIPLLGGRLLDIGCGNMPYRPLIESGSRVTEYVGLDVEERIPGAGVVLWDGCRMPFEDASFDCAFSTEVL